jgi:hypothetical protein
MDENKKCMCCDLPTLPEDSMFEICPLCGWQDDGVQNDDPDFDGGANKLSLNEYRQNRKVLLESIAEANQGKLTSHELID